MLQAGLELRQLRLGVAQLRLGLFLVTLAGLAVGEAGMGDLQAGFLQHDVLARDAQLLLGRADRHVGGGNIGDEADQDIVVARHRGEEVGVGGLDGTAELAPDVDLP